MGFLTEARARTERIRSEVLRHPFVRGIGDGTLDPARYRFYLAQDYRFLIEYARVLALAAAKSPGLEAMSRFATLLDATLNTEMEHHRRVCAGYGLGADDLERTDAAAACRAYTDHLVRVAWSGTLGEICASLVPCQYGYAEIARELAAASPPDNPYAGWIAGYTSDEYRELADWICSLTDRLADGAGADERARMAEAYDVSAAHEVAFWEMAWRGDQSGRLSQ